MGICCVKESRSLAFSNVENGKKTCSPANLCALSLLEGKEREQHWEAWGKCLQHPAQRPLLLRGERRRLPCDGKCRLKEPSLQILLPEQIILNPNPSLKSEIEHVLAIPEGIFSVMKRGWWRRGGGRAVWVMRKHSVSDAFGTRAMPPTCPCCLHQATMNYLVVFMENLFICFVMNHAN